MKNILLLVHDDDGQMARLHTAIDLTRALEGHLTCLDVTPTPVYAGNAYAGFGEAVLLNDERVSEANNKTRIKARVAGENISWSWQDATGDFSQCVIDAASLADLIVLNRALDDYPLPDMRTIVSRVLMRARKPVVAVQPWPADGSVRGRDQAHALQLQAAPGDRPLIALKRGREQRAHQAGTGPVAFQQGALGDRQAAGLPAIA